MISPSPYPSGKIAAVILAGGFGTRIKHLLPSLPKPMAPVAGRPFLDWVLAYLRRQGITEAVLSTGYLSETVEGYYAKNPLPGMRVSCVREEVALGTAGGFLNACAQASLGERASAWLVLNGDSLVVTELGPLLKWADDKSADGAIMAVELNDASRFGTLETDGQGWLKQFREKRSGSGWINAGIYLLKSSLVTQAPQQRPLSFETELFPAWLGQGRRLRVVPCEGSFLDIGTPETLQQAEGFVRANAAWFATAATEK
jgi:D-glycero-alpha-D-manno-heptose 1-phosphate guanylyltransferase